jgi:O-antigen ligase
VSSGLHFGTFVYKNHGAAYFSLAVGIAMALAVDAYVRNRRRPGRNGPTILYFLFAVAAGLAVVLTGSVSGLGLLGAMFLCLAPITLIRIVRDGRGQSQSRGALAAAGMLGLALAGIGAVVVTERLADRLTTHLGSAGYQSMHARLLAARQAISMAEDRWLLGWGAGCFQYGFTKYQRRETAITELNGKRLFWEHAHDDALEATVEFGAVGLLPAVILAFVWLRSAWTVRDSHDLAHGWLAGGLLAVTAFGVLDFPAHNPAILVTWTVTAVLFLLRGGEAMRRRQTLSAPGS